MIEIKTDAGFSEVLVYPKDNMQRDGDAIEATVIDDPGLPWFQALKKASGSTAVFRIDGHEATWRVHFNDVAVLESRKVAFCRLRLTAE